MFLAIREKSNGSEIFQRRFEKGRERNEEAQQGHVEERPFQEDGKKPEAGDRYRAVGGPRSRQASAEKEIPIEEIWQEIDKKVSEKIFREENSRRSQIEEIETLI